MIIKGSKIGNLTNKAELSDKVNNLFDRINDIVSQISDKIQDLIDKSDEDDEEIEADSKRSIPVTTIASPVVSTTVKTTEEKYQKMREHYKNKYAKMFKDTEKRTETDDPNAKSSIDIAEFNQKYTEAGVKFAKDLGDLVKEVIESFLKLDK